MVQEANFLGGGGDLSFSVLVIIFHLQSFLKILWSSFLDPPETLKVTLGFSGHGGAWLYL